MHTHTHTYLYMYECMYICYIVLMKKFLVKDVYFLPNMFRYIT